MFLNSHLNQQWHHYMRVTATLACGVTETEHLGPWPSTPHPNPDTPGIETIDLSGSLPSASLVLYNRHAHVDFDLKRGVDTDVRKRNVLWSHFRVTKTVGGTLQNVCSVVCLCKTGEQYQCMLVDGVVNTELHLDIMELYYKYKTFQSVPVSSQWLY